MFKIIHFQSRDIYLRCKSALHVILLWMEKVHSDGHGDIAICCHVMSRCQTGNTSFPTDCWVGQNFPFCCKVVTFIRPSSYRLWFTSVISFDSIRRDNNRGPSDYETAPYCQMDFVLCMTAGKGCTGVWPISLVKRFQKCKNREVLNIWKRKTTDLWDMTTPCGSYKNHTASSYPRGQNVSLLPPWKHQILRCWKMFAYLEHSRPIGENCVIRLECKFINKFCVYFLENSS
jgi:hypothetical protein